MDDQVLQVWETSKGATVALLGARSRALARQWIEQAPVGCVVTVEREPRTHDQGAKFYAICSALARSTVTWDGERMDKQGWHDLLIHGWMVATGRQPHLKLGLEGGRVSLLIGTRSMRKHEMSELLDYASAWATKQGVELRE